MANPNKPPNPPRAHTFLTKVTPREYPKDGWCRIQGGRDAFLVEDLFVKNLDDTDAFMIFVEATGALELQRSSMTAKQAIENILSRCRKEGIAVEPGEIIIDKNGNWTFRNWRMSKE